MWNTGVRFNDDLPVLSIAQLKKATAAEACDTTDGASSSAAKCKKLYFPLPVPDVPGNIRQPYRPATTTYTY